MMILLLEALCCKENLSFFFLLPTRWLCPIRFVSFLSSLFTVLLLPSSGVYVLALTLNSSLSFFPHLSAPLSLWKPRGQSKEFFSYQEEGLLRRGSGQGLAAKIRREGSCLPPQSPAAAQWRALSHSSMSPSAQSEKPLGLPSKESSKTAMWPTRSCQRDNRWKGFHVFSIQEYFAS